MSPQLHLLKKFKTNPGFAARSLGFWKHYFLRKNTLGEQAPSLDDTVQAGADSRRAPRLAGTAGAPPDPYQKTKSPIWHGPFTPNSS